MAKDPRIAKAVKDGKITAKQGANLPEKMVLGLIAKGGNANLRRASGGAQRRKKVVRSGAKMKGKAGHGKKPKK
jgi:hypothetical protein